MFFSRQSRRSGIRGQVCTSGKVSSRPNLFLIMQIRPKICYFIYEYACLRLDIPPIFEKLAGDRGCVIHGRPLKGRYRHQNQTEDQKLGIVGENVPLKIPKYLPEPI